MHHLYADQVGTIFLWMFWPSFNAGAAAPGDAQQRAVINTYYSLCSCVMAAFAFSALVTPSKKFSMVISSLSLILLSSSFAGASSECHSSWWSVCRCLCRYDAHSWWVFGYRVFGRHSVCLWLSIYSGDNIFTRFTLIHFVQPCLLKKLKIHDSCGVNNLHGMPGQQI